MSLQLMSAVIAAASWLLLYRLRNLGIAGKIPSRKESTAMARSSVRSLMHLAQASHWVSLNS